MQSSSPRQEHWFDELTRHIALTNRTPSRRQFVQFSVLGALLTGWRKTSWAQILWPGSKVSPGQCVASTSANQQSLSYAVETSFAAKGNKSAFADGSEDDHDGHLVLSWNSTIQTNLLQAGPATPPGGKIPRTSVLTLTLGKERLVRLQIDDSGDIGQPNGRSIWSTYEFGESLGVASTHDDNPFGLKSAHIDILGGQVQGDFNGRTFFPYPVTTPLTLSELQFVDGQPAPVVPPLDTKFANALNRLSQQAQEVLKNCATVQPSPNPFVGLPATAIPEVSEQPRLTKSNQSLRAKPADISSGQQQICNDCLNNCNSQLLFCQGLDLAAVVVACAFFPPSCPAAVVAGGAASGGCDTEELACIGVCWTPFDPTKGHGGDCCPVFCGIGSGCCDLGETCVSKDDPNAREGCCPANQVTCAGQCCAPGQTCCGGQCCSGGNCQPGNVCCPPGQPVCNGTCCPNGVCDSNGNCCASPSHLCGGVCCAPLNACCNNVCCANNAACVGGICCPAGQICGNACCQAGSSCQNAGTGTCSPCASGTSPTGCKSINGISSACCPPNVICCNGQCCPFASDQFGQVVCCTPVQADMPPFNNSQFGCHHAFSCTQ